MSAQINAQMGALWRRLAWPERGRLLGFALSLALGVGALFGVSHLLASVSETIAQQGRERLGADLKLTSWRAWEGEWEEEVSAQLSAEGRVVMSVELASMGAVEGSTPQLIALRGVGEGYPLRGELMFRESPLHPRLAPGEVWVAERLASARGAAQGRSLEVGGERFKVAGVLTQEPDGGVSGALSFAPRVLMRLDDLQRLPLAARGSRVRRSLLWAYTSGGSAEERDERVASLAQALREGAPEHVEVSDHLSAQPNALTLFERVALFFSMIGLVTLSLSTLSFSAGLLGLLRDHLPLMGALRSLGVTQRALSQLYTRLTLLVSLAGGALGVLLGLGLHYGLAHVATPWLGVSLTLSLKAPQALGALALALWVGVIVNASAQRALARASAQTLWRSPDPQLKLSRGESLALMGLLTLSLGLYLTWLSGSALLAALFVGSLGGLTLAVALLISLTLKALTWLKRALRGRPAPALRFALGHILGYRSRVWSALLSLSVGFSLIAGLQGVQGSLERALTLNDERAPHVFMIDVQEDQRDLLLSDAREVGVEALEALPLIRARVSSLKGERVSRASLQGESVAAKMRARTLTREHNLTTRLELGAAEQVVAGRWWSEGEGVREDARYVSLEERFAGRLGLEVGDRLTFDVQGVPLTLEVLSLRRVDWLSLRPNFLIVVPPGPLEGAPRTYVMAGKLSDERALERLSEVSVARAPNVSVVDMRPIFAEGRRLLAALNTALQLTGGLCALAGALLLILGVRRDHERRASAARALTSLGLSERRAWRWVSLELSLLGFISAFIISVGALSLTWGATRTLQLPLTPDLTRLGFWLALSALLAPLVGSAQALKRGAL